ncbi:MAG: hypothetical protein JRI34_12030, partial [Deltaproteobacteria bacterium]|nr:hypothetical protein [Deltaproteobacteria bacterium]
MRFPTVIISTVILTLYPSVLFSYNFLVILKDGREIQADIYGYEGDCIRLHQDSSVWLFKKDFVKTIKNLSGSVQKPARPLKGEYDQKALVSTFKIDQIELKTFEPGYVSTLGQVSLEKEIEWLKDVLLQARGDPLNPVIRSGGFIARWVTSPTLSVFNAPDAGKRAAEKALKEINNTLAETTIKIV